MKSELITVSEANSVAISHYGAIGGTPVLVCHGSPGSRLQVTPRMSRLAGELNVHVIIPDRPGYGRTEGQTVGQALRWAEQMADVVDAFGIGKFAVLGFSMGGMYALACAAVMEQRITAAALVGSVSPAILDVESSQSLRDSICTARDRPQELSAMLAGLKPEHLFHMCTMSMPQVDQVVLSDPDVRAMLLADCAESLCLAGEGMINDFAWVARNWGFALRDITTPVTLWHGKEDVNVFPANSQYLAEQLQNANLFLLEQEGHCAYVTHWRTILNLLTTSYQ